MDVLHLYKDAYFYQYLMDNVTRKGVLRTLDPAPGPAYIRGTSFAIEPEDET